MFRISSTTRGFGRRTWDEPGTQCPFPESLKTTGCSSYRPRVYEQTADRVNGLWFGRSNKRCLAFLVWSIPIYGLPFGFTAVPSFRVRRSRSHSGAVQAT